MSKSVEPSTFSVQAIRLLRCRKTRRYYNSGGWTNAADQAEEFEDEISAARACVCNDLRDVDLVLLNRAGGSEIFSTCIR